MHQLGTLRPKDESRLGRMLSAGRLTATMRSKRSGEHITLTIQCSAKVEGKWQHVPCAEATHFFITQGPGGWNSPKVGTYYPNTGKLYLNRGFDTQAWLYAIKQTFLSSVTGVQDTVAFELREANLCGKCGRELTDPISIERGIGPTCYGAETGSKHYQKQDEQTYPLPSNPVQEAAVDGKGRAVPRTFEALAAQVKS